MAKALRLRLSIDRGRVELRSLLPVDTLTPPADPAPGTDMSGFWVELRDEENRTLYRRVLPDLLQGTHEIFTGNPDEPIVRAPRAPGPMPFIVIVPDVPEAREVVFYGNPAEDHDRPAYELARLELPRRQSAP
jgi:hypothetical protein